MPNKYSYYEAYYVKANKKKIRPFKMLVFLSAIFAVSLTIFVSVIFSDFLSINVFSFSSTNLLSDTTYYAIELGEYSSREEAVSISSLYKSSTAAGYILKDGNMYRVLASAYKSKKDAENVLEKIINNVSTANIYEINVTSVNFSREIVKENKAEIVNAVNLFSHCYNSLYELSVKLDSGEISEREVLLEVEDLDKTCEDVVSNFKKSYKNSVEMEIVYTEIYLEKLTESVDELIEILSTEQQVNSAIKETYFKIIYSYINFAKEL